MAQKTRIVHFISGLQRGGAETVLINLIRHLSTQNFEQSVLYLYDGPFVAELAQMKIHCQQLKYRGYYANPLLWRHLWRYLKEQKPDLLHTSLWAANYIGRIVGKILAIPTVSSLHTVAQHEGHIRQVLDRILPITSTHMIAASHTIANSMISSRIHHSSKITVIQNGIDPVVFQTAASQQPAIVPAQKDDAFVIGSVGRLVPVKQFDLLIETFAELRPAYPHTTLMIVGSGPEEKKLRTLIDQLQLADSVHIITNQQAAPYYHYFNCFVQPSRYEGLSIALLEALTLQLPVIVTGKEGNHEVITNQVHGLVIPPGDKLALREALEQLILNKAQAESLRLQGYLHVQENYTLSKMGQRYAAIFKSVIK